MTFGRRHAKVIDGKMRCGGVPHLLVDQMGRVSLMTALWKLNFTSLFTLRIHNIIISTVYPEHYLK